MVKLVKLLLILFFLLCALRCVRPSGRTPTCVEEGRNATCQLYMNSSEPFSVNSTEGMTCTFWFEFNSSEDLSTCTIDLKTVDVNFENMRIPNDIVHAYREGMDHLEEQMPEYKDRTFLNHAALRKVVSFTLMKLRPSDSRNYKIYIPELNISVLFTLSVKQDPNKAKNKGYHSTSSPSLVDLKTPYAGGAMAKWNNNNSSSSSNDTNITRGNKFPVGGVVGGSVVGGILVLIAAVAVIWKRTSGARPQFLNAICERFSGKKDQQNTAELSPMNGPQQTDGHQEPAAENDTMV